VYAQDRADSGLGIVPVAAAGIAAKVIPIVTGVVGKLFKGSTKDRDIAYNRQAAELVKQGSALALQWLGARGGSLPSFTMPETLPIGDAAKAGLGIGRWANKDGAADAKAWYVKLRSLPVVADAPVPSLPTTPSVVAASFNPWLVGGAVLTAVALTSLSKRR